MAFDELPTDASIKLLSEIHDLSVRVNEEVGNIQNFQQNRSGWKAADLMRLLARASDLLIEQNKTMVTLVERQLTLDDRLSEIVAKMEDSTDGGIEL